MVQVIKFDGRKEEFDRNKIIRTCIRVGSDSATAHRIAEKVEKSAFDGITTKEIYSIILKELESVGKKAVAAYTLKESVAKLDPFIFEIYVKRILEAHNYKCESNRIVQGKCVEHQIDIIARNDAEYLVECKRHKNPHRFCGLGICLQVQARLEDICDGSENNMNSCMFGRAWIITNTKFSEHAKKYASAKNIRLTGWKYPENASFEVLVDSENLYPISVMPIRRETVNRLFRNGVITIHDINEESLLKAGMNERAARRIIGQKNAILMQ